MIETALPELPCSELVELVTDHLEGRLSARDRARFQAHIADCEYCATCLEQMRQTIRVLGRLPEAAPSAEARVALLAAFRGWRRAACNAKPGCSTQGQDKRSRRGGPRDGC